MNWHTSSAHNLLKLIAQKKITPEIIAQSVHTQIKATDNHIKAYRRVHPLNVALDNNADVPLPIAIKDNICIKGHAVTCASKILEGFIAPYDATVIQKLRDSGAVIVGQTNMDEFAFGSSTETSHTGPTANPWKLDCVPGGSSGGSTAAVAAHQTIWALGSDTGGSIRQPASFCGVVGLKPTYGRVSRYGLIAFASSLDQIGPITKDVHDAALLLNIIAGYDPHDSTSVDVPVPDYTQALNKGIKGLKIGVPKEYFIDGMDPAVQNNVTHAIEVLKKQGATFTNISLPHTKYAVATYYIIATAEASSNLARFDGVQYGMRQLAKTSRKGPLIDMYEETRDGGFGAEAKRRIMLGTYVLSSGYYDAFYLKGLKVRTLIKKDFDEAFKTYDAILTPTSPSTAFKMGERMNDRLSMYLSDIYTTSANLSGIPAISIPCGFSENNLPVGLQIMAKPFNEEMLFRIGHAYQQATDWHQRQASGGVQ